MFNTINSTYPKESLKTVDEISTIEGITTNADTKGLAKANLSGLVHSLVGECAWPGHNSYAALLVDVAWHDSNLALQS